MRRGLGDAGGGARVPGGRGRAPARRVRRPAGGRRAGPRATSGRRSRITVHGDYDVDGVAATAVLVRALRTLGADVDWYLPSRIDDGYGLAAATVERLAARGTELLMTVDCAITAVEEVAAARAAGLDVVVTDHHAPRADGRLPDAPIVHPRVGGHPCADAVRGRRRVQARAARCWRAPGRTRRSPTRTSTWWRSRRSPTSCRSWARTGGSCARAARAGRDAQAGPAGADGGRRGWTPAALDASAIGFRLGAADQRRGPPAPRRRGARAPAHRGSGRAPARSPPSSTR